MPYADKEKQLEYQRQWMAKRRIAWFNNHGPCAKCGSWLKLELDHIDPGTKVDHKIWSWSEERRSKELAKCQVLCRKCHRKKTNKQFTRHGTKARYRKGCRCKTCVTWFKTVGRSWRHIKHNAITLWRIRSFDCTYVTR